MLQTLRAIVHQGKPGHRFFFVPDEVEPLDRPAGLDGRA